MFRPEKSRNLDIFLLVLFILAFSSGRIAGVGNDIPLATSSNLADHLVVSEIYCNAENESDSEFIEFYNPTDRAVDLSGWSFSDDGGSSWVNFEKDTEKQNSLKIPAHGFFLVVDGEWPSGKDDNSWPSGDVVDEISLDNSTGEVKLRNGSGEAVDSVSYDKKTGDGQGFERKAFSSSDITSMRDDSDGGDGKSGNAYDSDSFTDDFVGPLSGEPQNSTSDRETSDTGENESLLADPGGPYECSVGEEIQLDGTASTGGNSTIKSYSWDFDGDDKYDDGSTSTPHFNCDSRGTKEVSLKVKDGAGATDSGATEISVGSTLEITAARTSLPADGSSTAKITIQGKEGSTVSLVADQGTLSGDSAKIGSDGKAEVTFTAPAEPGHSTLKAATDKKVDATTVFFHEKGGTAISTAETGIIKKGEKTGTVDGLGSAGVVADAEKLGGSVEKQLILAVARYENNPEDVKPMSSPGEYVGVYADPESTLSQLTLKIYPSSWPTNPSVKYWSRSASNWVSCSNVVRKNSAKGFLEIAVNSNSEPPISALSHLSLAVGSAEGQETGKGNDMKIRIAQPGWNLISIPLEPHSKSPMDTFTDLDASKIRHWNPGKNKGNGGYVNSKNGFNLKACQGNWVHISESQVPKEFTVTGNYRDNRRIKLSEPGWHQVGFPGKYSLQSLGVKKEEQGEVISLSQAIKNEWIWRFLWKWNPKEKVYSAYEFKVNEQTFKVGAGYWVKTRQPNLRLIVPYDSPPTLPSTDTVDKVSGGSPATEAELGKIPTPPPPPKLNGEELEAVAAPNPLKDADTVKFTVTGSEVEFLRVSVIAPSGNEVFSSVAHGRETLKWKLAGKKRTGPSNGLYVYRITVKKPGGIRERKVGKLLLIG